MSDSLISKMEEEIKELIGGISENGGYSHDWNGRVDIDVFPVDDTCPCAKVELTAEVNIDESEADSAAGPTGAFAEAYYNALNYKISIKGTLPDRTDLLMALDDLKKVFGKNYTLGDSGASAIMYRGFKFVKKDDKDNAHLEDGALIIESNWIVRYYQSRTEPDKVAEV
ncbi:MAG: hypothetical protein LBB56_05200 [Chitinispirillales bacterium]|jgi:hypothetical protein|nr:hypothetical protein [Chitinispirillales bacterium]